MGLLSDGGGISGPPTPLPGPPEGVAWASVPMLPGKPLGEAGFSDEAAAGAVAGLETCSAPEDGVEDELLPVDLAAAPVEMLPCAGCG
jgi:hypothetical protein